VTFAQIRDELQYVDKPHIRFNLCSYKENDPEYNKKLECKVKGGKLIFEAKHKVPLIDVETGEESKTLDKEIRDIFKSKKIWPKSKKIHVYYSDMRKQLKISDDFRFGYYDKNGKVKEIGKYTKSVAELGSEAKYIKQFEDDTFVELKGYHKIKKAITAKFGWIMMMPQLFQTFSRASRGSLARR
jgi:hypothetical protein